MWHDGFQPDVSVVEKLARPVLIYAFLAVALRLAGKRELAQLNSLDFVVLLAVANAVQNGIIGAEGTPRTLISMGVVDREALRKERLTEEQLSVAIATQGAGGLDDVEEAVLVPNGTIVTRMKEMDRNAMRFMDLTTQIDELKAMIANLDRRPLVTEEQPVAPRA